MSYGRDADGKHVTAKRMAIEPDNIGMYVHLVLGLASGCGGAGLGEG